MINWDKISASISDATGTYFSIAQLSPVTGGDSNQAWHLQGRVGPDHKEGVAHYFVKLNAADKVAMFAAEHAGLAALAATGTVRRIGNSTEQIKLYFGLCLSQSDFYRQNHDRFRILPIPMARICRVNAKDRRTPNPAHKPIHGEQNCCHQAMR